MTNLDHRNSGVRIKDDGTKVNIADLLEQIQNNTNPDTGEIDSFRVGDGSLFGSLTIGTSATQLKIGASDLVDRHTLIINNSAVSDIYIGFDNTVTVDNGLLIPEGTTFELELSVQNPTSVFAIADANTEIRLGELKG